MIHAHSDYSHDATDDIASWAQTLVREKLNFVFFAEHVEDFTPARFSRYVEECRRRSTTDRLLVPGMEYNCAGAYGRIEVILLGERAFVEANSFEEVWGHKTRNGLTAILPHPGKFGVLPAALVSRFDLIEVWNLRYDGGYFPPKSNFALFEALKDQGDIFAVCGVDYHVRGDSLDLVIVVETDEPLASESLINSLRRGRFYCQYHDLFLTSSLEVPLATRIGRSVVRYARRSVYHVGRWVGSSSVSRRMIPKRVREGIRKIIR